MKKKYYNDAFIGNKDITVSFSKYGELLRLYYPLPDYRQYSAFFHKFILFYIPAFDTKITKMRPHKKSHFVMQYKRKGYRCH